jgi:hypothetical protein
VLVPDGQEFAFSIFDPKLTGEATALGAMAVATGVVTGFADAAIGTDGDVPA